MRTAWTLFMKEWRIASREKMGLAGILFFSLLTIIILFLTFASSIVLREEILAAVIWVATLFGGTLQVNRTFDAERTNNVMDGIRLIPGVAPTFFLIKFILNATMIFCVLFFSALAAIILFNYPITDLSALFFIPMLLGVVGFSAVGTTFSGMVTSHHKKDMLLPAIAFPILVPVILSVIQCYPVAASFSEMWEVPWFRIIVTFDVIYAVAGWVVFEKLLEE